MDRLITDKSELIVLPWNRSAGESLYYGGFAAIVFGGIAMLGGLAPAILLIFIGIGLSIYHQPMMAKTKPACVIAEQGIGVHGLGLIPWDAIESLTRKSLWLRTIERKRLLITLYPDVTPPQLDIKQRLQIRPASIHGQVIEIDLNLTALNDDTDAAIDALLLREGGN